MMTEVFEQAPGPGTEAGNLLASFWPKKLQEIRDMTEFKIQELPLARIKKIMKQDEEVKMISAEAPVLFAKAAEIFINELSLRAWVHTEDNKRRTLQRNDIAMAITKYDMFDFLIDIVPRDELKPNKRQDSIRHTMMGPQEQIQYYFQLSHQYQQQQPQAVQAQPPQQLQVGAQQQQQQQQIIGGIAQPQQGTVVVTSMPSGQPQLIQTQNQEQGDVAYPIHFASPSMQYVNRLQQFHLQQQQQQQQQQAVQIQGVASTQPQVAQTQQQSGQQVQTAQAVSQVQVTAQETQQQATSQNITPSTNTSQPHAEYASYGGQIYQIQTASQGGTQQVYITATAPDPQQQPQQQQQQQQQQAQSAQQAQAGDADISQSADQQGP